MITPGPTLYNLKTQSASTVIFKMHNLSATLFPKRFSHLHPNSIKPVLCVEDCNISAYETSVATPKQWRLMMFHLWMKKHLNIRSYESFQILGTEDNPQTVMRVTVAFETRLSSVTGLWQDMLLFRVFLNATNEIQFTFSVLD